MAPVSRRSEEKDNAKLIVSEFMSLDGVMRAPGGGDEDRDGGFEHGGWTMPYWHDAIGQSFFATMQDVDALLLGRRTYVTHAEAFELKAEPGWWGSITRVSAEARVAPSQRRSGS